MRKRNKVVKNMSAGDLVRSPTEIKLDLEGENMDRDWILSNWLNGKNMTLRPTSAQVTGIMSHSFCTLAGRESLIR